MNENGEILNFPLYHGTSSIFLDSIQKSGLGSINIIKKYQVMDMFSVLVIAFQKNYDDLEWWQLYGHFCEKMVSNSVTKGGFNYRYGGIYLSPSLQTTKRYACSNPYGSELITYFKYTYEELYKINPKLAEGIFPLHHPLRAILAKTGTLVVLEINNIPKEHLTTEQGEPIDDQLECMYDLQKNLSDVETDIIWQQYNFESKYVIEPNNLRVLELHD